MKKCIIMNSYLAMRYITKGYLTPEVLQNALFFLPVKKESLLNKSSDSYKEFGEELDIFIHYVKIAVEKDRAVFYNYSDKDTICFFNLNRLLYINGYREVDYIARKLKMPIWFTIPKVQKLLKRQFEVIV